MVTAGDIIRAARKEAKESGKSEVQVIKQKSMKATGATAASEAELTRRARGAIVQTPTKTTPTTQPQQVKTTTAPVETKQINDSKLKGRLQQQRDAQLQQAGFTGQPYSKERLTQRKYQETKTKAQKLIKLLETPSKYNPFAKGVKQVKETGKVPTKKEVAKEQLRVAKDVTKGAAKGYGVAAGVALTGTAIGAVATGTGALARTGAVSLATRAGLSSGVVSKIGAGAAFTGQAAVGVGAAEGITYGGVKTSQYTAPKAQREVMKDDILFKRAMQSGLREETKGLGIAKGFVADLPIGRLAVTDEKIFEYGVRGELQAAGYTGKELEAGVSAAKRQRKAGEYAAAGGVFSSNIVSEIAGKGLIVEGFKKGVTTKAAPKVATFWKTAKGIFPAGVVEGATVVSAQQRGRYKDKDWTEISIGGAIGGVSAGALGGTIAATAPSTPRVSKFIEGIADVLDPYEKPGDIFAAAGERAATKATKGRVKTITPTITVTKDDQYKFGIRTEIPKTRTNIPVRTFGGTPTQTQIPVSPPSKTPVPPVTKSPVPSIVTTPTETETPVPDIIKEPTIIPLQQRTTTTTKTTTKTPVETPVSITAPTFPGFTPFMQFGGRKTKGGKGKPKFGYTASFDALILGKTGTTKTKAAFGGFFTGQQTRVIVSKGRKKKTTIKRRTTRQTSPFNMNVLGTSSSRNMFSLGGAPRRKTTKRKVIKKKPIKRRKQGFSFGL